MGTESRGGGGLRPAVPPTKTSQANTSPPYPPRRICHNGDPLSHRRSHVPHPRADNTWSTTTHPGLFPFEAHFSWFGGGTHNVAVSFWSVGELASPGMVEMAETGFTAILRQEIDVARNQGLADADIHQNHWFCPGETTATKCGVQS